MGAPARVGAGAVIRLALPLAPDTTATTCGSCPYLTADDPMERHDCRIWRVDLDKVRPPAATDYDHRRHFRCVTSELAEPVPDTERPPPEAA